MFFRAVEKSPKPSESNTESSSHTLQIYRVSCFNLTVKDKESARSRQSLLLRRVEGEGLTASPPSIISEDEGLWHSSDLVGQLLFVADLIVKV